MEDRVRDEREEFKEYLLLGVSAGVVGVFFPTRSFAAE